MKTILLLSLQLTFTTAVNAGTCKVYNADPDNLRINHMTAFQNGFELAEYNQSADFRIDIERVDHDYRGILGLPGFGSDHIYYVKIRDHEDKIIGSKRLFKEHISPSEGSDQMSDLSLKQWKKWKFTKKALQLIRSQTCH